MHQPKTIIQRVFKPLLFVPLFFTFIVSTNAQNNPQKTNEDPIYYAVQKMPVFPGGEKALLDYINHNLKYPIDAQENEVQGTVIVRFVVSSEGKVEQVEVLRNVSPSLDNEGVRVVSSLPDWTPGEENGKKVSVYYTLPLKFRLEVDKSQRPAAILDGKLLPIDFDISKLNRDSIQSVFVIKPDQKEKLAEIKKKYGAKTSNGVFVMVSKEYFRKNAPELEVPPTDEKIYDTVDKMPEFPGGEKALLRYIRNNLNYPVEADGRRIQGTVIVRFIVTRTGKVDQVVVLRSLSAVLDRESVRVISSLPDWIPGVKNGEEVGVYFTIPLVFQL
jgi:TonB family protein